MYLQAKFGGHRLYLVVTGYIWWLQAISGGHRLYRNGDISSYSNSYINTFGTHCLDRPYCEIFKISNTNLLQKNKKKEKKNTDNCKAFCVLRNLLLIKFSF